MNSVRQFPGLLLALALASIGAALMLVAWAGWADRFGWPWALVALVLSWFGGFNAFAIAGAFFFAQDYLHWSLAQSIALAAIGMIFGTMGIIQGWVSFLIGGRYKPDR